jgi:hypothetical protein
MPSNYLRLGNWNALCDSCGRKFKASSLRKRWDGLMVCEEDWEMKHPQLTIRVPKEQIAPPWARPEPPDVFLPYCTLENSQGIIDLAVVDCARVDYTSSIVLDAAPIYINNYPAIAQQAVSGISISGLVHTMKPM